MERLRLKGIASISSGVTFRSRTRPSGSGSHQGDSDERPWGRRYRLSGNGYADRSCGAEGGSSPQVRGYNFPYEFPLNAYQERAGREKYAHPASPDEIEENDFNLNIPRYVDTFEEEEDIDIEAVQKEIDRLETELAEVRRKMASIMKEMTG